MSVRVSARRQRREAAARSNKFQRPTTNKRVRKYDCTHLHWIADSQQHDLKLSWYVPSASSSLLLNGQPLLRKLMENAKIKRHDYTDGLNQSRLVREQATKCSSSTSVASLNLNNHLSTTTCESSNRKNIKRGEEVK